MVIRRSSTTDVRQLLNDLSADGPEAAVTREAAVARLRVIGARAVHRVLEALDGAGTPAARAALLRVLEGRTGSAVADRVVAALDDPAEDVRVAAIATARTLLDDERGAELLDRLTTVALGGGEAEAVRLAAVTVLAELPSRTIGPVLTRLQSDANPAIRAAAVPRTGRAEEPQAELDDASRGDLPADPQRLIDALGRDGATAPLPTLHRLVTALREREPREHREARRRDWLAVRGAVHELLARRDSRVALYDLRETIDGADAPLPASYMAAAAAIGDAACLEAIGAAYARAGAGGEALPWRSELAAAARAIAKREKITSRHEVTRRMHARWGDAIANMLRAAPRR